MTTNTFFGLWYLYMNKYSQWEVGHVNKQLRCMQVAHTMFIMLILYAAMHLHVYKSHLI